MNLLKLKIKQQKTFIILFFCILLLHLFIRTDFGDDYLFFRDILDNYTLNEFISIRYQTWSSRLIIETVLVLLVRYPLLWKILDSLIYVLLAKSIFLLLNLNCNKNSMLNSLIVVLLLLYPLRDMSSAGWIATTLNYLWVSAFMLYSLTSVYRVFHQHKIPVYSFFTLSLATLYASNQEQACACLCALFAIYIVYLFSVRKCKGILIILFQFIICLGNLIMILQCPGNALRSAFELQNPYTPVNYSRYSMIDKLILGFENSMTILFSPPNFILLIFLAVLFTAVLQTTNDKRKLCFFAFPLAICSLQHIPLTWWQETTNILNNLHIIENASHAKYLPYAVLTFWGIILLIILLSFLEISKCATDFIYMLIIFGCGFGSSMIMGFSPSYAYSENRTSIFLQFSIIYCTVYIVQTHLKTVTLNNRKAAILQTSIGILVILQLTNAFLGICGM